MMYDNKFTIMIKQKITRIYVILMLVLFPMVFHDFYFDINNTKKSLFVWLTLVCFIIILLTSLLEFIKSFNLKKELIRINKISKLDLCIICFFCINFISTIASNDFNTTFFGELGRGTGLLFVICICLSYYMISRYLNFDKSILLYYLISACFIYLLAMLNFFGIDLFGFFEYLSDYQSMLYISTIGNTNFFGLYVCLSLPIALYLFCECENIKSIICYGIIVILGFSSLIVSNCDGAYLGIFIFLLIYMWFAANHIETFIRWMLCCSFLIITAKIIFILSEILNNARYLHSFSHFLATNDIMNYILLSFIIMILVFFIGSKKSNHDMVKRLKYGTIIFYVLLIVSVVGIIICVNQGIIKTSKYSNYLVFNEEWGTGRGFIWQKAIEGYSHLDIKDKIIGVGPDNFRMFMINTLGSEFSIYDNAHNEFIQYLVTTGAIGLLINICLYLILSFRLYKQTCKFIFVTAVVVITYAVASSVSINQPITTPLLFIMIGINENINRATRKIVYSSNC